MQQLLVGTADNLVHLMIREILQVLCRRLYSSFRDCAELAFSDISGRIER